MNIRYKLMGWEFNHELWSATMATAVAEMGLEFMALSMNVSQSALENWSKGYFHDDFKHPNMTNFIKACNLLDLDPREFFRLEDI